jgi:hypothetical protein
MTQCYSVIVNYTIRLSLLQKLENRIINNQKPGSSFNISHYLESWFFPKPLRPWPDRPDRRLRAWKLLWRVVWTKPPPAIFILIGVWRVQKLLSHDTRAANVTAVSNGDDVVVGSSVTRDILLRQLHISVRKDFELLWLEMDWVRFDCKIIKGRLTRDHLTTTNAHFSPVVIQSLAMVILTQLCWHLFLVSLQALYA